ncbi:MAG: hypothetical protein ACXVIM_02090, partial [Acidimicrobiia bacterium]
MKRPKPSGLPTRDCADGSGGVVVGVVSVPEASAAGAPPDPALPAGGVVVVVLEVEVLVVEVLDAAGAAGAVVVVVDVDVEVDVLVVLDVLVL